VCWSIYVGWMPWGYLADSGIMDKWAEKYGIDVEIVQINDYVESINQYTAGEYDGCSMTNMDALSIPAGGGVDTTALIVGDYSNGNDGIILKDGDEARRHQGPERQPGRTVGLALPAGPRARQRRPVGKGPHGGQHVRRRHDRRLCDRRRHRRGDLEPAGLRNPGAPGATKVFDSAGIPGEIIDIMMVNTETLADNPAFGKALTGAWYEVMGLMAAGDEEALTAMAEASGTDLAGYKAQLDSTEMFYDAGRRGRLHGIGDLPKTMQFVAEFLFDKGILGEGAPSPEFVGVAFPDGSSMATRQRQAALRHHLHADGRRRRALIVNGRIARRAVSRISHAPDQPKPSQISPLSRSAWRPSSLVIVAYAVASHYRRLDNPADKLLPSLPTWAPPSGAWRSRRTGARATCCCGWTRSTA
jgi:NitT/TauT family transport system substrate-binding protein